ncbi:hypothetical protein Bca52824_080529 [Brassica carinata]|uniref:Uncharacterized protein n=1 Tax=Brassica carinata TaxID=52824 RepID=A0A8X7PG85_BRACI|nr:hypothetical protein Bca52824_080529 [Brassica carinata]
MHSTDLGMSQELPKRIFKEGEETQVTQVNNKCELIYVLGKLMEGKEVRIFT